ncbi:minor structural protein [Staphylococcus phage PMBT8]|nr:minor structural protein [Staphylococcus phage PMBT8]
MIHVLDFEGKIIDYIDKDDLNVFKVLHKKTVESETLDIEIDSDRAEHFKKRHRVIIKDKTDKYREFIIDRATEESGLVVVEATASHLVDLKNARPLKKGKYEKMGVNEKVSEILRDSRWSVKDSVFAGITTTTWDKTIYAHELLTQIANEHKVKYEFEVVVDGYEVTDRFVNIEEPTPLFKGREIVYGKDLVSMKRSIDFTEVRTALYIVGPEEEKKPAKDTMVFDDDAQEQFGDSYHYIWDVYEPSEGVTADTSVEELQRLGKIELAKRNSSALSYELNIVDLEQEFPHEIINFGDIVRIKNPDFVPSLYAESEVLGIEHELISGDCNYTFGNIVERSEDELLRYFRNKLYYINQKLNDGLTNVNTIVADVVEGQLEYFERKIFKGEEPPESPVNDMLWLDTRNPDVAVLRRYWNGQWINATAEKAKDIGAITREQALYSELNNTFTNLSIQHAKLLKEMYQIINSEYFVDEDLKQQLNMALDETIQVYNNIKNNIDSMTDETATIGKLIDTQAMFLYYREKMQGLYNVVEQAKISIDNRFKLLQSQYTEEKYNDAMRTVATVLGGEWNPETRQLTATIPNEERLNQIRTEITNAYNQQISSVEDKLRKETDSKLVNTKEEISATIKQVEESVSGLESSISNSEENALKASKEYADAQDKLKVIEANAYADGLIEEAEQRAIQEAQAKLEEAKRYTEEQASLKADEAVKPIVSRIIESEASIKAVQDKLLLTATKTDIQETLNAQLSPIKRDVEEQKASIQVMSNSIDSKVSNSKYETDQNNIVQRLNQSESQTQQLSNKISQTVSKSDFQSGLDAIQIGGVNLFQSYNPELHGSNVASFISNTKAFRGKFWATNLYNAEYLKTVLIPGKEYVYSYEIEIVGVSDYPIQYSGKHGIIFYSASNSNDSKLSYKDIERLEGNKFRITQTFTAPEITDHRFVAYSGLYTPDGRLGTQHDSNIAEIRNLKLEEGNKSTGWTPALEDVEKTTNEKLTQSKAEILIEAEQVTNRVSREVFNASSKTLERYTSEFINNVSDGMSFRYDDNGNIQSHSIGPQGVRLRGDKVDITVNKEFNVLAQSVSNKADETNIINKINLSTEGLDINVNKVGIHGGDSSKYIDIQNDEITLYGTYDRAWRQGREHFETYTILKNGMMRFRNQNFNRSIYLSDFGISTYIDGNPIEASGTLAFFDYTYDSNARGVTLHSGPGVVGIRSESNRVVVEADNTVNIGSNQNSIYIRPNVNSRPGQNEFSFYIKKNDTAGDTDGTLLFGEISNTNGLAGSGLRFKKAGVSGRTDYESIIYATDNKGNIGTGSFHGINFYGSLKSTGTNVYVMADTYGELRVTNFAGYNNGSPNYESIRVKSLKTMNSYAFENHSGSDVYMGVGANEFRITDNNHYNGGKTKYKNVRANIFYGTISPNSSEKFKTNIEEWNVDASQMIRDTKIYEYNYKYHLEENINERKHGVILERETPEHIKGKDSIDLYELVSTNTKALQEQILRNDLLEEKIKKLEEKING